MQSIQIPVLNWLQHLVNSSEYTYSLLRCYQELELQTTHFAYARTLGGKSVITTVNNGDNDVYMELACGDSVEYVGSLTGECVSVNGGQIHVRVPANSGEIWIPAEFCDESFAPIKTEEIKKRISESIGTRENTGTCEGCGSSYSKCC